MTKRFVLTLLFSLPLAISAHQQDAPCWQLDSWTVTCAHGSLIATRQVKLKLNTCKGETWILSEDLKWIKFGEEGENPAPPINLCGPGGERI